MFRFDPMWLRDKSFEEVLRDAPIASKTDHSHFMDQLSNCGKLIQEWNKTKFGKVQKQIHEIKEKLKKVENMEKNSRCGCCSSEAVLRRMTSKRGVASETKIESGLAQGRG